MSENECRLCDKLCSFRKHPFDRLAVLEARHATLLTRHNALVEAVAWLRGVDDVRERFAAEFPWIRRWSSLDQYVNEARSEVDRLLAEGEG